MAWDAESVRGAGLVAEPLRELWRHATLLALADGAARPVEILDMFNAAVPSNATVFGQRAVYRECVSKHLGWLLRAALVERIPIEVGDGRQHAYQATVLGSGLLQAVEPAVGYAVGWYGSLVRICQAANGLPVHGPPRPDPAESPRMQAERIRRRCAIAVFGYLLEPAWTWQTLTALSAGAARVSELLDAVNAKGRGNMELLGYAEVSRGALYRRLEGMQGLGLVAEFPQLDGSFYRLTGFSRGLLGAFGAAARFGVEHRVALAAGARIRQTGPPGP